MQFSLDRFYRINRRAVMWGLLFGLIYILRDFFALVFVTFLIVSFTLPLVNYFQKNTRIPRKVIITGTYLLIFIGITTLIWQVVPKVIAEASAMTGDIHSVRDRFIQARNQMALNSPSVKQLLDFLDRINVKWDTYILTLQNEVQTYLREAAKLAFTFVTTMYLSVLFAFLIILDLSRLTEEVRRLGRSRLHDFYEQSAGPVVRFAAVIARSFRAQAVIAVSNTVLTLIGFAMIGLPQVALLTVIVFFFSFIPVLGVFISTTPAMLVAINWGGHEAAMKVLAFVVIIHIIEAYILNPLIYGRHLKLNPVLVIIILYVGHHFFGMWGMLLGVPVAYYFIHYVFKVPDEDPVVEELTPVGESVRGGVSNTQPQMSRIDSAAPIDNG